MTVHFLTGLNFCPSDSSLPQESLYTSGLAWKIHQIFLPVVRLHPIPLMQTLWMICISKYVLLIP